MENLLVELFKLFPENSRKGLVFGAGIGLVSLLISGKFDGNTHLLAHKISGVFSLTYLFLSLAIFTFNRAFKKANAPLKGFLFYYLGILLAIVLIAICYCLNLGMSNFEEEMTLFFAKWIDNFFGYKNGESYFVGFIICYAIICFSLSGFLETTYEALYEVKSKISK
ncbi:MAG: hypothetical protein F6K28_25840 [Microcoleus sp. SIO2G3]|nr:hypothetical protein [Microcoleus sp. SIO2G3]